MIFVNLPVTDLDRSVRFYEAIGGTANPEFCDGTAQGIDFSEAIHVMLLSHEKFATFTPKPIADRGVTEVLNCLSCASREEVDDLVSRAETAGGVADPSAVQDHGFMYGRSFEDPDGHIWEVMWMDLAAFRAAKAEMVAG